MKKLLTMFATVVLVLGVNMPVRASTITFDESYVNPGAAGNRYDGTQISNQYTTPYGVTWADIYPSDDGPSNFYTGQDVCEPGDFNGINWGTDNYLFVYGNNTGSGGADQTATVTFSNPSNSFSIEYRRPQASGTFDFTLYLNNTQVYDSGVITWDPLVNTGWEKFTAPSGITFDTLVIWESDKSSFDNLSFNAVPIPSAFWLLGSGLLLLIHRRCKS